MKKERALIHLFTLWLHFCTSVLGNSNWDKISHNLTKNKNFQYSKSQAECNSLVDEKKKKKKNCKPNLLVQTFGQIGQIYTILKFIKAEIEKTIAQISIWKCRLGILDIGTQLNFLKLKWT